jgi:beta-galactosidase
MQTKNQVRPLLALLWLGAVGASFCSSSTAAEPPRAASAVSSRPSSRLYVDLDANWRFSLGDFANAMMPGFDDSAWRQLDGPHDWSSEGPFGPQYSSGNGYAPGGVGWYRKQFTLDSSLSNRLVAVEFDGVYDHAEVWVNGHFIGGRPYGYASFECALTPLLKFGAENVLAVRVDHSRFADSRWYSGSGIYRHVRLRMTDKLRIGQWGVFITTPEVATNAATVRIESTIENSAGMEGSYALESEIVAADGKSIAKVVTQGSVTSGTNPTLVQQIKFANPQLWSPASPTLYTLRSRLSRGSNVVDETATPFGIRTIRFDPDKGFFLNGISTKLKGVCIHHDAGSLGAAVPEQVLERRLRVLQELGVNAIRTSHNPPAPELLDLCDRLGLLVKDEAFDEFTPAKRKWINGWNSREPSQFGYAESFSQWSVTDAQDMVRRDRNHPSVIMWSIGNEIDYANDPFSHPVLGAEYRPDNPPAQNMVAFAKPLIAAVKRQDPTRPVTMALANVPMSDAVGLPDLLDIVGYNYQESRYADDHAKHPARDIFGSETSHRYDAWLAVRDHDFISGQFLWTGIDYLGEAGAWPNRGSSSGMVDLCGFKKPLAWFRQSLWSDQPMVYLCASPGRGEGRRGRGAGLQEHWNWSSQSTISVYCYTTCPEVVLTLNGRPIGTKRQADAVEGVLSWEVSFEPGVLKAVGRGNAKAECEFVLQTAGPAQRIELLPDVTELRADGRDIGHLEFRIVDAQGVRVPNSTVEVTFAVEGPASLIGIENGDLNSPDTGKQSHRNAFHGRGLAFIQSQTRAGRITVSATAAGLAPASVVLNSR